jgi:hypothetical protein
LTHRLSILAALAVAVGAAGVAVKRDRDQQRRLDELSLRVADLSETARGLVPTLRLLPALVGQQRCTLAPGELERILRAGADPRGQTLASATPLPAADKTARVELSSGQKAALDRAHQRLENAISRHTLTREDVLEMRAQLATVGSTQETEALRARISTAINHQQLVPQDRLFLMP